MESELASGLAARFATRSGSAGEKKKKIATLASSAALCCEGTERVMKQKSERWIPGRDSEELSPFSAAVAFATPSHGNETRAVAFGGLHPGYWGK